MSRVKLAALIATIGGFLAAFIQMPPEQQNAVVAPIIAVLPPAAQSWLGTGLRILSAFSLAYALFRLHSKTTPTPPTT